MTYQLKKGVEAFQVVDGPFARRHYRPGIDYREKDIPPQERHKFVRKDDGSKPKTKAKESPTT